MELSSGTKRKLTEIEVQLTASLGGKNIPGFVVADLVPDEDSRWVLKLRIKCPAPKVYSTTFFDEVFEDFRDVSMGYISKNGDGEAVVFAHRHFTNETVGLLEKHHNALFAECMDMFNLVLLRLNANSLLTEEEVKRLVAIPDDYFVELPGNIYLLYVDGYGVERPLPKTLSGYAIKD